MDIKEKMKLVISDLAQGKEFYTVEMLEKLKNKIGQIFQKNESIINESTQEKIKWVEEYLMKNVNIRRSYFDAYKELIDKIPQEKLKYRTAYAALVEGEAMCAGYVEASRILLECLDLRTSTLLSKLPEDNKKLLHYVCCVHVKNNGKNTYILDPERQKACEKKQKDFKEYLLNMYYIKPDENFYNAKVLDSGVGILAPDYLSIPTTKYVIGKNNVDRLFNEGITNEI